MRIAALLSVVGFVSAVMFVLAGTATAYDDDQPTTTWNVTPTLVAFPDSRVCPSGSTLVKDTFQSAPAGTHSFNTTVDGVNVTVEIEVHSSGMIDFEITNGVATVVFVKGGTGNTTNKFQYAPPVTGATNTGPVSSDTGLHTGSGRDQVDLSHIDWCLIGVKPLDVTKTATTSYEKEYDWTIDKSADPSTLDMFVGDSGEVEYTIDVDLTITETRSVSGTIEVENPNTSLAATVSGVTDSVNGKSATVTCPGALPQALAGGATLSCTYLLNTGLDGTEDLNTATATTTGLVPGDSGTAAVTWGAPTISGPQTINVTDQLAGFDDETFGPFSDDASESYTRTFECDDDEGQHTNTATIDELTTESDSATVTVNCHELQVRKNALTSLTRTWEWTIDKSADQTSLTLADGQLFLVNYKVEVAASSADSDHAVSGVIGVRNPAPIDAVINTVADIVSPAIAADVDCGVTFPYTLTAGESLSCTYSADLPNDSDRTNTATATLQNHEYDSDGIGTPSGTTDFSATVNVSFANATVDEVDECVDVTDDNLTAPLGTVCGGDAPKTFSYSLDFGKHPDADVVLECGDNSHTNTAAFETNDTGTTGSDSWTVRAKVQCATGCTLTQGYWKTHSDRGPAPYDDAWKNLGVLEEDTLFFKSGKTWYTVFWTPPAGNAFYNLAHQYMAAKLNILNGASTTPAVVAAIAAAEALFNAQGVNDTTLSSTERRTALQLATTLDNYNNGLIGPGHCSE